MAVLCTSKRVYFYGHSNTTRLVQYAEFQEGLMEGLRIRGGRGSTNVMSIVGIGNTDLPKSRGRGQVHTASDIRTNKVIVTWSCLPGRLGLHKFMILLVYNMPKS